MSATVVLTILLLALAAGVAAYVLRPLLAGTRANAGADAAAVSREVLRERRRELEAALAHLPPDAPERRAALAEFVEQADAELASPPAGPAPADTTAPRRRPWVAAAFALLMLAPPFALYRVAGAPEAASPEVRAAREPATLDELAADLRRRLEAEPDALEGWRLLGRVELARARPDDARLAFERALALAPNDPQSKVDLAEAIAQAQGAVLEGRPIALIREALAADPRHPKALALAGAYAVVQRDFPTAIGHWKALLDVLPADSAQARQIEAFIADLQAGRAPRAAAAPPGDGAPPTAAPPAAQASAAPPGAAPAGTTAAAAAMRGRVEIDARLADRVRPDDTLFVAARTIDDAGRPVGPPVAVVRARAADLPFAFALDDASAMSPAARLSGLAPGARVVVVARLSRTGDAAARAGDLQGTSAPAAPGARDLRIAIDTVLE